MNFTKGSIFDMRSKAYQVATANALREVRSTIVKFEDDRHFLELHCKYTMSMSDQNHCIFKLCPVEIRRAILQEFDEEDFESYQTCMQDILDRVAQELEEIARPGLHAMEDPESRKTMKVQQHEAKQQQ